MTKYRVMKLTTEVYCLLWRRPGARNPAWETVSTHCTQSEARAAKAAAIAAATPAPAEVARMDERCG